MEGLGNHTRARVLEVACGDGRLTVDLLSNKYGAVDMFDIDPKAIDVVKSKTFTLENVQHIDTSSMEAY